MRLLTLARDLKRRKARERQHLFVCEGVRTTEELLRSSLRIHGALVSPVLLDGPRGAELAAALRARNVELAEVSPEDFRSAADTDAPQGVLAIAEVPQRSLSTLDTDDGRHIVILDGVQDPGNVGTILRTAAALEAAATIALPGTVDLWNAKVVRSAMGALFHHFTLASTWDEIDAFRRAGSVSLWVADSSGDAVSEGQRPRRIALVVGNEGAGASQEARGRADRIVAIPIANGIDSLNVAVATGILLHELRR